MSRVVSCWVPQVHRRRELARASSRSAFGGAPDDDELLRHVHGVPVDAVDGDDPVAVADCR
eukprot:5645792-Pyramimonas_sp.AAC.1